MILSNKARADLRIALEKSYGKELIDKHFTDEYVDEIGDLLLTLLAEVLKMRVAKPELFEAEKGRDLREKTWLQKVAIRD